MNPVRGFSTPQARYRLFSMNKETDWRISDTAAGRNVMLTAATTGGFIAGDRNAAGYIKAGRKP